MACLDNLRTKCVLNRHNVRRTSNPLHDKA